MESTTMVQFLQSLCSNSPWKYAVFWKLQHHSQMLLTLEDGYCHTPKQGNFMESLSDNVCSELPDGRFSSNYESKLYGGNMVADPIELVVAHMSCAQYTMGDGIFDEVACSGNYCWVFSEELSFGECGSKFVCKWPDDWRSQFAAGIKTLLLVPVLPHGVLQLGSLEVVAEDQALVAYIKDRFFAYKEFVGRYVPSLESVQFPAHSAPSLFCTMAESELPAFTMSKLKSEDSIDAFSKKRSNLSTMNQMSPSNNAEYLTQAVENDMLKILNGSTEDDVSLQSMYLIEELVGPDPLCQLLDGKTLEIVENSLFRFSCIEEGLKASYLPKNDNIWAFGENAIEMSGSNRGMVSQSVVDEDAGNYDTFFSFPRDCELHKALGSTVMVQNNKILCETPALGEEDYNCSDLIYNGDLNFSTGPTIWDSNAPFIKKDDAKHPSESVLANVICSLSKTISGPSCIKSFTNVLEQLPALPEQQSLSERHILEVNDVEQQSCVTSAFVDSAVKPNSTSPASTSLESVMSALTGEEHQKRGHHYANPKKVSKPSSNSKRRARTRDNQKPRPRDRQLIQDHLKELRDMVPDGVKCSIDGLLARTIEHMLFLRSVTDQADRLRQLAHKETSCGNNLKTTDRKVSQENGTSWAFELGSEQQICPIKVEDLELPGHMLIEMLCSDHGCFLDIAEVIRRLDLTIVKGVMGNSSGSTCAQFVVEVPRGFHRLDIFWPLMQLLQ